MSFKNKTIWITGASSGIGKALTKSLHKQGANLIISSRRSNILEEVKAECKGAGNSIQVLPIDLSKVETLPEKAKEARHMFGPVDILFNNGGVSQRSLVCETDIDIVRELMEVNFFGYVALAKAVLPDMLKRQSGHIVVTSSVMGKFGTQMRSAYSASNLELHGRFYRMRQAV